LFKKKKFFDFFDVLFIDVRIFEVEEINSAE